MKPQYIGAMWRFTQILCDFGLRFQIELLIEKRTHGVKADSPDSTRSIRFFGVEVAFAI